MRRAVLALTAGLLLFVLVLGAFPWGLLASRAVRPLSSALGRPVTVGLAHRFGWFGFVPEVALADVRIGQPEWIGAGTMVTIREARVRFPVLPLLFGRFRPRSVLLDGLALSLVRTKAGRASWDGGGRHQGGHNPPSIQTLTIRDGTLALDDRRRHVRLTGSIAADAQSLSIAAAGTLRGRPLTLEAHGGAVAAGAVGRPYPLRVVARSPLVDVDAVMRLDAPLDTGAFSAHVAARGQDLTYLDDIVQAGLFPTQAFDLQADVRHDGTAWRVALPRARIGRSLLSARAEVTRVADRTKLDARIDAAAFAFDDFESTAQHARGVAAERAVGDRIVPGTRLELDGLARLDGTVRLVAHRLIVPHGSPFRALSTTATIDRQRLVLRPLDVSLVTGHLTGQLVDDDRGGVPRADIDLTLGGGATIEGLLAKGGSIAGPLRGRIRLRGRGTTLREAIGRSDGTVGLAVASGSTRRDYATFAGGDIGKSIGAAIAGSEGRVPLRCMVGRFVAKGGRLTPAPLLVDTVVSRSDGRGTIDLSSERIDLMMIGQPKHPGLVRSTAPTRVFGTLASPRLDIKPPRAPDAATTGTLARIGYFLKGLKIRIRPSQDPPAPDADCPLLVRQALR